jgi:hypothetical protein
MTLALAMGKEDLGCEMALFAYTPYGLHGMAALFSRVSDIRYG